MLAGSSTSNRWQYGLRVVVIVGSLVAQAAAFSCPAGWIDITLGSPAYWGCGWGCPVMAPFTLWECSCACQPAVPTDQTQALTDLYNSAGGSGWTHADHWTGPYSDPSQWWYNWYGIDPSHATVNNHMTGPPGTNNIIGIDLSGNNLAGSLPTSIGALTGLT